MRDEGEGDRGAGETERERERALTIRETRNWNDGQCFIIRKCIT